MKYLAVPLAALALSVALMPAIAPAQPSSTEGPPVSADCSAALAHLDAARLEKAAPPTVEAARQKAVRACLGAKAPTIPRKAPVQPPVGTAPIQIPAPVLPPPPSPALSTSPVPITRPSIVTHCDAGGCWDNEGRRLNRIGQDLMGPRGGCLPSGAGFICP
jgi:hypothetical protein